VDEPQDPFVGAPVSIGVYNNAFYKKSYLGRRATDEELYERMMLESQFPRVAPPPEGYPVPEPQSPDDPNRYSCWPPPERRELVRVGRFEGCVEREPEDALYIAAERARASTRGLTLFGRWLTAKWWVVMFHWSDIHD